MLESESDLEENDVDECTLQLGFNRVVQVHFSFTVAQGIDRRVLFFPCNPSRYLPNLLYSFRAFLDY